MSKLFVKKRFAKLYKIFPIFNNYLELIVILRKFRCTIPLN